MKKIILSSLLMIVASSIFAATVSVQDAQNIAEKFWQGKNKVRTRAGGLSLVKTEYQECATRANSDVALYIFADSNEGYVIVSADDRTPAILGYSLEGAFDPENIPANMQYWLSEYVAQMNYSTAAFSPQPKVIERAAIAPLVTAKWNQGAPYNDHCHKFSEYDNATAVTGCVATALAQVMSVWKYPDVLPAANGYQYKLNNNIVNIEPLEEHIIDWSAIKDEYDYDEHDDNVAWLMRHCGQEVNMLYSPGESGAVSSMCVGALLRFGYDNSVKSESREKYSEAKWEELIYNELAGGRAVLYSGSNQYGGHAFVCDGYEDGYFHINWGWGGMSDGYFLLYALDPNSQGIGGSAAGYNFSQEAIFGIAHGQNIDIPKSMDLEVLLFEDNTLYFNIWNNTGTTVAFEFGLGLIDESGEITPLEIAYNGDLLAGYGYTDCVWTLDDPSYYPADGTYKVVFISREVGTEDWQLCHRDDKYIKVVVSEGSITSSWSMTFEVDAVITGVDGPMIAGYNHTINFSITNVGGEEFGQILLIVTDESGYQVGGYIQVAQPTGTTLNYSETFMPSNSGTYTIELLTLQWEVLAQTEITIRESVSGDYEFSNIDITDWYYKGGSSGKFVVKVFNGDVVAYDRPIFLRLFKNDLDAYLQTWNAYMYGDYSVRLDTPIEPGEEQIVEFTLPEMTVDTEFCVQFGFYSTQTSIILTYSLWGELLYTEIEDSGYTTFSRDFGLNLNAEEMDFDNVEPLTANVVSIKNNQVELTPIEGYIPSRTGLLLKGTPGAVYAIALSYYETALGEANDLVAQTEESVAEPNTVYTLTTQNGKAGFAFNSESITLKAGTAYIPKSAVAGDVDWLPLEHAQYIESFGLAIAKGWNWISTPLAENVSVLDWFDNGMTRILNQTQESIKDDKYGVVGSIKNIEDGVGYKAFFNKNTSVELSGFAHGLDESPIVLKTGWNWISYPYHLDGKIEDVITNAEEGDYISSQYGFTSFVNGTWEGGLEFLTPGCGYLYKSASAKTLEFDFTKTSAAAYLPAPLSPHSLSPQRTPEVDIHKYPNTMNVIARLYDENGAEISDEGYNIYAVCGNELRGVGKKVNGNYYITIYGYEAVEISFFIEDLVAGTTCLSVEPLTFVSDVVGSRNLPYAIIVGEEISGISPITAVKDSTPIFRMDGTVVSVKDIYDLPKGTYVVGGKKLVK